MVKIIKKIKLFSLFLICLFFYLIKGSANKKPKEFKKFLIVHMAKLGDTVCITPIFKAIKDKNCKNNVWVLSNSNNINLLKNHPYVDNFFIFEKNRFWLLIKEIKKENFDFGCITSPNFLGLAILYLSNIKFIVAPAVIEKNPYDCGYYRILRTITTISINYQAHHYFPLQYLKLLEPAGIYSDNITKTLGFSQEAMQKATSFLKSKNLNFKKDIIVAIHVGAGNKVKIWPIENWSQLINSLKERYAVKIIIVGSKRDEKEVFELLKFLNEKPIYILDFNLDEFKALMNCIDILISCDSGPVYIAEAFGKYIIDITAHIDEREQPPRPPYYQKGYLVFNKNIPCRPCSFIMDNKKQCRYGHRRCLTEISPNDILPIFESILSNLKK